MALAGSGNTAQYWSAPIPAAGAKPFWLSAWSNGTFVLNDAIAALVGGTAFSGLGPSSSAMFWSESNDAAANVTANSTLPAPSQTWIHYLGATLGPSSRKLYSAGVMRAATTTTLAAPQTLTTLLVGKISSATVTRTARSIAEICFGYGVLSDAQVVALAQGQSPLTVCPTQIDAYFPLRGNFADLGPRRTGLTHVGGPPVVWTLHPPVAQPPSRRLFRSTFTAPPAVRKPLMFVVS